MHPLRSFRWTTTSIAALVVAGLGGCRDAGTPAAPLFNTTPGSGEFKVCKVGTAASFTVTVNQEAPTTLFLGPGECAVVATGSGYATVTENADAQVVLDSIVKTFNESGVIKNWTHVGTYTLGPEVFNGNVSVLLTFYNRYVGTGRMTGGGRQITIGDLKVTRGFTIHCDITLSNNLEINWPNNHWHITKPLTSAECVDDPMISPEPPPAPFDTFIGVGEGELNGVPGSIVRFVFVDSGERGGVADAAQIMIWSAGGDLVLNVPLSLLDDGNIQAHYDQPHGNKPPK